MTSMEFGLFLFLIGISIALLGANPDNPVRYLWAKLTISKEIRLLIKDVARTDGHWKLSSSQASSKKDIYLENSPLAWTINSTMYYCSIRGVEGIQITNSERYLIFKVAKKRFRKEIKRQMSRENLEAREYLMKKITSRA